MGYTREQLDLIFTLYVYHYADLSYPGEKAQRKLEKLKIGPHHEPEKEERDAEYAAWVMDEYESIIRTYTKENWPDGWDWTHEYYGAQCLSFNPGWNAPRDGFYYVGDDCGRMMNFSCFQALEDYTKESLIEL